MSAWRLGQTLSRECRSALRSPSAQIRTPSLAPSHFFKPADDWIGVTRRWMSVTPAMRKMPTAPRKPKVNVEEIMRRRHLKRLRMYAFTSVAVSVVVVVFLANHEDSITFYLTPSQAIQTHLADPVSKSKTRLGGLVLENSIIQEGGDTPTTDFIITDLASDVLVTFTGALPDLFREGHSAVVEGTLRPLDPEKFSSVFEGRPNCDRALKAPCYLNASEVLAKHDERYMPREIANAIQKNREAIKAAQGGGEGAGAGVGVADCPCPEEEEKKKSAGSAPKAQPYIPAA